VPVPEPGKQSEASRTVVGVFVEARRVAITHDSEKRDAERKAFPKSQRRRTLSTQTFNVRNLVREGLCGPRRTLSSSFMKMSKSS
jgi:hypothetical protein